MPQSYIYSKKSTLYAAFATWLAAALYRGRRLEEAQSSVRLVGSLFRSCAHYSSLLFVISVLRYSCSVLDFQNFSCNELNYTIVSFTVAAAEFTI